MKIRKAIIFAAGMGTRFFPITKTIQKEMLPILDRPIIDYIVDDCIEAGIEEVILVVNDKNDQIKSFYSEDQYIYRYLERMKKLDKYSKISKLHSKVIFKFVRQKETDSYGTAVPLILAREYLQDEEAFLALTGDDFFLNESGKSEVKSMIENFEKNNADGLITCIQVPMERVSQYGIAEFREENGVKLLTNQIEKPEPSQVNSNFITLSKSIFTPKIFEYLDKVEPDSKTGELYLTTAFTQLAQNGKVIIYEPKGKYIDTGNVNSWLIANLLLARENSEIWEKLSDFVNTVF